MARPESNPHSDGQRPDGLKTGEQSSTFRRAQQDPLEDTVVLHDADGESISGDDTFFGRYRVTRVLGQGGMGSVFLGYDDQLDRQVAIKVPHPRLLNTVEGREAFLGEARTLARLEHPRVISVFDAGQTDDGRCYVVFKYVKGPTLAERMQNERLSPRESSKLMADVADALHYAHKLGFVHRDIKPSNILIDTDGQAWVADFGLAVAEQNQRILAGDLSGTPMYMSPEQTRGDVHHLDGRTDIWALGVMLYELLTGRRPFGGSDRDALFEEINRKDPRPPRMIDETIPDELQQIVLRCLQKSVTDRYTTAHDLARDLRSWGGGKRNVLPAVAAATCAVLALIGVIVLVVRLTGPVEETSDAVGPVAESGDSGGASSDLALLINEMRGLRRDLGESPAVDPMASDPQADSSAVRERNQVAGAAAVELPPGDWAPIPLPTGFGELGTQLREARLTGDEDQEHRLLLRATNELIEAGHYAIAEHLANRMVELSGNDPSDKPFAYGQLGLAQYRLGKYDAALASYQHSVDVYQSLYDRMMALPESTKVLEFRSHLARLLGISLMRMGNVHKAADDYQLARARYEAVKEIYETHDRRQELVTLLLNYGGLESNEGNYQRATELLQQGLEIARQTATAEEEAELLVNLGNTYSRHGDNASALEHFERAYGLLTPQSAYTLRSALLGNWSMSLLETGQHRLAAERLKELEAILRPGDTESQRILELAPAIENLSDSPD